MIRYITNWYTDKNQARNHEQMEAMRQMQDDPLCVSRWFTGPAHEPFAELVSHADPFLVNILINSDCYIDHADTPLLRQLKMGEIWCLSRTDLCKPCSQDAWAWRGLLLVPKADYKPGYPGCDNAFAYDVACLGYIPLNPAISIRVHHLHRSEARRWSCVADKEADRVHRPYLFVEPVKLGQPSRLQCRDAVMPAHLKHLEAWLYP